MKIYLIYTDESKGTNNSPENIEKSGTSFNYEENGTDKIEKLYCIIKTEVSTVHYMIIKGSN